MSTKRITKHSTSTPKSQKILEFWHKIEFFIPFDLDGQVLEHQDKDWAVRCISSKELSSLDPQSCGDFWKIEGIPKGRRHCGYEVYLGIFDKSLLSDVVKNNLRYAPSDTEAIEDSERGDLEGLTCFARIILSEGAEPQMDRVSVSTAPWALGRLQQGGIDSLDFDAFHTGLKELTQELERFNSRRLINRSNTDHHSGADSKYPLLRSDIEALQQIFFSWANIKLSSTDEHPIAVIKLRSVLERSTKSTSTNTPDTTDDDNDTDDEVETELDILNSFYAKDLQRILGDPSSLGPHTTLSKYLAPTSESDRIDIYTSQGQALIRETLHPSNIPDGRWLSESKHNMSLMQQFAINRIFMTLKEGCVFSINGPPGTGKTTLLRDIFAENITQRAKILSRFESARDAFLDRKLPVNITKNQKTTPWKISELKPELTGFEMLVVSSNNAAVQNISHDLPKTSALGKVSNKDNGEIDWRHRDGAPKLTYLQSAAIKYFSRNKRGNFDSLSPDDNPWGLISCALGNKANRSRFAGNLFSDVDKDTSNPTGYDEALHQSIWQWGKHSSTPTFQEARENFQRIENKVKARKTDLTRYIRAYEEVAGFSLDDYVSDIKKNYDAAELLVLEKQDALDKINFEIIDIEKALANISRLRDVLTKPKISRLKKFFSRSARHHYQADLDAYNEDVKKCRHLQRDYLLQQVNITPKKQSAELALDEAKGLLTHAREQLSKREKKWKSNIALIESLKPTFKNINRQLSQNIESKFCQSEGLWQDHKYNHYRSELFAAALTLHEAWLKEVIQKGSGFSANLYAVRDMLQGGKLENSEDTLLLWQSLFMVVPVISSTFASVGNQFRDIGANALGWLFIDEAGQAVPQAAAGALWRAKRAVVVGDPLQIEPVFTVPAKLIEALAASSGVSEDTCAWPNTCSVQNLADAANAIGASISNDSGETQWIGSPLRVHRRCADPMFRIANAIAYKNKMIHGAADTSVPSESLYIGPSSWVHIPGHVVNKQVVQEQVDAVVEALVALYSHLDKLPPIYIISPFKRVASTIKQKLSDLSNWKTLTNSTTKLPPRTQLITWCKDHIGTVHTFQGKQASIVWFVLGCDKSTTGAVKWASSKPNILNVAFTRAEHRIFVVGCANLWGSQKFFNQATPEQLPRISKEEFRSRMLLPHSVYK